MSGDIVDEIKIIEAAPLTTYKLADSGVHHACIRIGDGPNAERPLCQGFGWWIPAYGDRVDYDDTHKIDCGNCRRMKFFKENIRPYEEDPTRTQDETDCFWDPQSRTWTPLWDSDHTSTYDDDEGEAGMDEEDEDKAQQLAWFPSIGPDESAYIALLVENNQRAIGLIPIEDGIEIWEIGR